MPLQPQVISVSLSKGVDTKVDPKQVIPGKLLNLQNGRFITTNSLRKRNGYAPLGSGIEGSTPVGSAPFLSSLLACPTFQDQLLGFSGTEIYAYNASTNRWTDKGAATSTDLSVVPAIRNAYSQTLADSTYHSSGIKGFLWEDSRGGVRYSVMDAETGQYFQQDVSLDTNGSRPKVMSLGNYIIFLYYNTSTHRIRYAPLSVASPSIGLTATDFATNVNTANPNFDAAVMNQFLYVGWNNTTGGGGVSIKYLVSNLTISSEVAVAPQSATNCIGVFTDVGYQQVWVSWHDGTDLKAWVLTLNLGSTVLSPHSVETLAAANNVIGYANNGSATLWYQVTGSPTSNTLIRTNTINNAGTTGTASVLIRSVGLFSKPFTYSSVTYFAVTYESSVQPMYFFIASTGRAITKFADGSGGGLTTKPFLGEVSEIDSGKYAFSFLQKDRLETTGGAGGSVNGTVNLYNQTGVMSGELDFTSSNTFLRATLGNNLHFTGGILESYDGVGVIEDGFNMFPETVTVSNTTSGGALVAGTYQYAAMYEWVDNYGQIHRSAPSIPVTVVVPTGVTLTFTADTTSGSSTLTNVSSVAGLFVGQVITGTGIPASTSITSIGTTTLVMSNAATASNNTVTMSSVYTNSESIAVSTLRITQKVSPRAPVSIVLYRTQAAGTIFYRVTSITSPTLNSTTADSVTITDHVSDISLTAGELLYTTGGEVENIAPPAICLVCTFGNRVIAVPAEDRLSWWYSKEVSPGVPAEFSDLFVNPVDARGGDITAIAPMDDKLIQFKSSAIFYTTGQGPTANGSQNDYSPSQLITTDCGCINPRSVVTMPLGLMFQSGKGIYLLDRSLATYYIGSDVEAFNNYTITSAVLVPNTNEVRFTTSNGITLVYDYFVKEWAVDSVQYGSDASIFQDLYTYANPNGTVFQETIGSYTDNNQFYPLRLFTSWLSFGGLQGYQRTYQALILGEYKSAHQLLVRVSYDYNPSPTQEEYIDATTLLGTPVYGADSVYGLSTPYGGPNSNLYQFRVQMNQQKCQAIQFQIEDVQSSNYGEGMSLSAIALEVGIKKGPYKVGSTATYSA